MKFSEDDYKKFYKTFMSFFLRKIGNYNEAEELTQRSVIEVKKSENKAD